MESIVIATWNTKKNTESMKSPKTERHKKTKSSLSHDWVIAEWHTEQEEEQQQQQDQE